jgi:zinc protease
MISRSFILCLIICVFGLVSCGVGNNRQLRPDEIVFAPLELIVPVIEPIVLPNGIRIYLYEDRELPLIKMTGVIGTGSIGDQVKLAGQGSLFAALLEEGGAGEKGPSDFEEYLEDLAIDFSVGMDAYATTLALSLLSEDLGTGLTILKDLLRRPKFSADRFELVRRQLIEAVRRQDDNPGNIAHRAFNSAVYGEHPFGQTATVASLGRVKREHLVDFHRKYFTPENFWLAISGDFNRLDMEQKLRALFADWPRSNYQPVPIPELPETTPAQIWLAEKQIPQTTIMIGGVGLNKDNPDMLTVRVMNAILGGSGFNSRLMREIRSNRGLAYSVYSYYMIGRRLPGSFIASGGTKNETAVEMVSLMLAEMDKIRTELVTEEELALAKTSRINSFVFAFIDSHEVLTQQMRLDFYQYPEGYLQTYRQKVTAITREDILRVAKKYLQPEKMTIILVGQPDQYDLLAKQLHREVKRVPPVELPGVSP